MGFSDLLVVRQKFASRALPDIDRAVREALAVSGFASALKPGARVAIGVGSRGISNLAQIVRAVVAYWKGAGCAPFLFPAMGSHGSATGEGQAEVLAHFGVTEASMGCPVISSLDVVSLGCTPEGIETSLDRNAFESDGVFLVNRVKWHTSFSGRLESGLFKMMAIGLGKLAGAHRYHAFALRIGMEQVIRSVGRRMLDSGKILGGLAILEDAYHQTGMVEAVPAGTMCAREEELLEIAKSWAGRIPVNELDVLILDEIGKNFSGTGMDTKIVNRSIEAHYNPFPNAPIVRRIFARGISEHSYGNAQGVGLADIVTDRLIAGIDHEASNVNALTASTPSGSRIPIHYPTDRECIERIATTAGKIDPAQVTFGWIRNTLELSTLALSANLEREIAGNPNLEIAGGPYPIRYDAAGNLIHVF